MSPAKRQNHEYLDLVNEVDRFLVAFEKAKSKPRSGKLLDALTTAVINLERAMDLLR